MIRALALLSLLTAASCGHLQPAMGKDGNQWAQLQPGENIEDMIARGKWFRGLMQPDNPRVSCCGEADAYWADSFEVEIDKETGEGRYVAIVTDEREDGPLGRPHIAPGTRIVVPNYKLKYDAGNPTGHGVIFVGIDGHVFCYVAPGGV